ncbi:MAG: 4Fe-4S binding protein, partial [Bacteroidales bacterium]|nr:4Fe-4S binding protein [Bacteroidales bacterium]
SVGVHCEACSGHCPSGAIQLVRQENGRMVPAVDTERCIGCGACEYYCPARPFAAIYVEGHLAHRII